MISLDSVHVSRPKCWVTTLLQSKPARDDLLEVSWVLESIVTWYPADAFA